jgi:hypothetical protein
MMGEASAKVSIYITSIRLKGYHQLLQHCLSYAQMITLRTLKQKVTNVLALLKLELRNYLQEPDQVH